MSEPDVLARAARALREAHDGEHRGAGFTRARIMTSLHGRRQSRLVRWIIGVPLASALLVGSAWAQSTGSWRQVWTAVVSVLVAPEHDTPEGAARSVPPVRHVPPEPTPLAPNEPAARALQTPDSPTESEISDEPAPPAARESSGRAVPRAAAPKRLAADTERDTTVSSKAAPTPRRTVEAEPAPAAPPTKAAVPAPDPELASFRAAHELHFRGGHPRAAIRANTEYLESFPNGRFVPEARYNIALNHVKLGDIPAARAALRPFAEGRYGGYRQREAQQLLEALP